MKKIPKISAVYMITNMITREMYIGSSKDVHRRLKGHMCLSHWKRQPNKKLYQDMQKYGIENFEMKYVPVALKQLREMEQKAIDMYNPEYNKNRAKGLDRASLIKIKYGMSVEQYLEYKKQKHEKSLKKAKLKRKENAKKYNSMLCLFEGKRMSLQTLANRLMKLKYEHPYQEAKKYIIKKAS